MAAHTIAQSSPSEIITTFNNFFATVPGSKSFDMTYKVYIQDLADSEDRNSLARLYSSTQVSGPQSICLASYGNIRGTQSTSSTKDRSFLSLPTASLSSSVPSSFSTSSSRSSSTTSNKSGSDDEQWSITMSQVDRIYKDNMARKQRSMVNLTELNRELGLPFVLPPPAAPAPDTVYENLDRPSSIASTPSTFADSQSEFARVIDLDARGKNIDLFIKIGDCFD